MKRKIALLVALILALSVALISCNQKCDKHTDADANELCDVCGETLAIGKVHIWDVYNDSSSDALLGYSTPVYSEAELLEQFKDMVPTSYYRDVMLFTKNQAAAGEVKLCVYNLATGEVFCSVNQEEEESVNTTTVRIISVGDGIVERVDGVKGADGAFSYKTTLYSPYGDEITSKTDKSPVTLSVDKIYSESLYLVDEKVYKIDEAGVEHRFDVGMGSIDDNAEFIGNNFYLNSDECFYIFDDKYNLTAYYNVGELSEIVYHGVLENGNYAIQYVVKLPDSAVEYDVYHNDSKCDLKTVIMNAKDGSVKDVDFDYGIGSIANAKLSSGYADLLKSSVVNFAALYKIVDKNVNTSDYFVATCDNELNLTAFVGNEIPVQSGETRALGNGYFIVINKADQTYIVKNDGTVIGNISGAYYDDEYKLLSHNGKLYDFDLNLVFDTASIEYDHVCGGYGYEIYSETKSVTEGDDTVDQTTYYLFDGRSLKTVGTPGSVTSVEAMSGYFSYACKEEKNGAVAEYTVYCNIKGDVILKVETSAENYADHNVFEYSGSLIIKLVSFDENNNRTAQYYVAK